jgi:hypothetical protein
MGWLCLEDGCVSNRAYGYTLRSIKVPFALYTGGSINHVGSSFGDRVGRALSQARAACNALIRNLHGHSSLLLEKRLKIFVLKITVLRAACQMTNVSGLDDFVTESKRRCFWLLADQIPE